VAEAYAEGLPLERVFRTPVSRILDFLIINQKFDYSESDISRLAEVPHRTLGRALPILRRESLVVSTRKSGKQNMYKLNLESERALALQKYVKATMRENIDVPIIPRQ
jgi:DNA-binding transcriptional ArsR family regulator